MAAGAPPGWGGRGERGGPQTERVAVLGAAAPQMERPPLDQHAVPEGLPQPFERLEQGGTPTGLALAERRALLGEPGDEVRERHADRVQRDAAREPARER